MVRLVPQVPEVARELPSCPGIYDPALQKHAELPPAVPDPKSPKYYLHATYSSSADRVTCTTVIRAHACDHTVSPGSELCKPCADAKVLVLKKDARKAVSEQKEVTKYTPLSKVSHTKVASALKVERAERAQKEKELQEIRARLDGEGVEVSHASHELLKEVVESAEKDSFTKMFWEEQKKAFHTNPRGMRWHPMMVRLAILIHSQSPSTYRTLKEVGIIRLPAESTLRDYQNVVHPTAGYSLDVFFELKKLAEPLRENQRWVCLLHDEISIKGDLVYDRVTGELVGFVDQSQWKPGSEPHENIATHALVFMVVGLTSNLKMSIGYFPTRTATADEIFPLFWRAVGLLETICNLKVIASTSDKASSNQKFIRMHGNNNVYKAPNMFAPSRDIFFVSDPPHLIKTVRNNLSSSGFGKQTKRFWNNGQELLWHHIVRLYEDDSRRQLRRTKLTAEHVYLTPQSVMRVNLAAQVLSHSVGSVMAAFGGPDCQETAKFILLMDKLFDCLNARSPKESVKKHNQFLAPYTSVDDARFRFMAEDFMGYIEDWKTSTQQRAGFSGSEKKKMFLTPQTYEGLKTTVSSIIEVIKFLLNSGVEMVLTNKFCQDPLEAHFGRHRALGVRAENPTLWTFGYQENKLRMQRSLALAILPKGNVKGKRLHNPINIDDTPLPKIRR